MVRRRVTGTVEVRAGPMTLAAVPAWGGRVASLRHRGRGDFLLPLEVGGGFDPWRWPKAGAYPLIPYHGRIAGAVFHHGGVRRRLLPHPGDPAGNALHGPAHRRPWRVEELAGPRLVLSCDYAADEDWPWAFRATQRFELSDDGLRLGLDIVNRSDEAMPAGLGWHPYLPKAARIETDARRAWPRRPGTPLPTGTCTAASAELRGATHFLSDWTRVAVVLPDGARITITASPPLTHLVVHDDPSGYTCLEPVSHLADALNLPPDGATAMHDLAPGERLEAELALTVSPADAADV